MRLVITGATGFIGAPLCEGLLAQGHALTLLTRGSPRSTNSGTKRWIHWTPGTLRDWDAALDGADGVVNLAGEHGGFAGAAGALLARRQDVHPGLLHHVED